MWSTSTVSVRWFCKQNRLQSGDVIVAGKGPFHILDHYIVYWGEDRNGVPFFIGNFDGAVHWVAPEEAEKLLATFKPNRVRRLDTRRTSRDTAKKRAESLVGQPYSFLGFNCEHFANFVQYGQARSKQVNNASDVGTGLALGLGLVALVGIFSGSR